MTRRGSNVRDAVRLSVVIPCWNEARYIKSLLEALDQQDCSGFEIVVVDEQSTDGTRGIIRQYAEAHPDLRLKLITNPRRSIPAGLNLGIQHASGEIIMRLDGHSCPAPTYVSRCLATLEESGADVVGGRCDIQPGAPGQVAQAIALAVSSPLGAGDALYRLRSANQRSDVDTVAFGCFRRQTWEAVGGYNEGLLSNEDYEFNLRVRLRGGRVHFDPRIRCEYFARPTFSALAQQYWRYGWWKAQMLKQHPASLRLRQVVPLVWAAGGPVCLLLAGWFAPLRFWTFSLWALYFGLLVAYAAWSAGRQQGAWRLWPALVVAYGLIHFIWGWGAWAGAFAGGWNSR